MWGQVFRAPCLSFPCRIIPTRVGTRNPLENLLNVMRDHPHACGDKFQKSLCFCRQGGSSPRVWGQENTVEDTPPKPRIIPTRVGTSFGEYTAGLDKKDHPHACGDKYLTLGTHIKMTGSSPRVWGQVTLYPAYLSIRRIIPTRVGTRFAFLLCLTACQDHPHACGDKPCKDPAKSATMGSSPRVWGQAS